MLGRIRLFLRCIDYSLSMLIIVCCLAFGSWWFSAENYSYEESLYPKDEACHDICKIYSDLAFLSQKRNDWKNAVETYQAALETVFKIEPDLHSIKSKTELALLLEPIYDRLGFCYDQLGDKNSALKAYQKALALNPNFTKTNSFS